MVNSFEDWYKAIPPVTRGYLTIAFLTTAACNLDLVSPLSLYFNYTLIFQKYQAWRLLTNFFFFGMFGLDFLFHMFFMVRYSRLLEEGHFRSKTSAFFYMLLLGGIMMTAVAPWVEILFLGSSLTFMMVYVWGRLNPHVRMSFLGLFTFTAPYLPWVLLGFSCILGNNAEVDLLGIFCGHVFYYLDVVYPRLTARRPLKTPAFLEYLLDGPQIFPAAGEPLDPMAGYQYNGNAGAGGAGGNGEHVD